MDMDIHGDLYGWILRFWSYPWISISKLYFAYNQGCRGNGNSHKNGNGMGMGIVVILWEFPRGNPVGIPWESYGNPVGILESYVNSHVGILWESCGNSNVGIL